jgi:SagB-type dehydrogenase family enzyme
MQKHYSRLHRITLPVEKVPLDELKKCIEKRASFRDFSCKPIELIDLTNILHYGAGLMRNNPSDKDNPFRAYPSAGAKYPIEVYPLVLYGNDINPGLYHFNPFEDSLEILLQPVLDSEIEPIWISQEWPRKAAVIILLTSAFRRTMDKYGDRGIIFSYIEAGHLVQNIHLLATSINLGCCAIGKLDDNAVIKLLDINPRDEYPIYAVAVGN